MAALWKRGSVAGKAGGRSKSWPRASFDLQGPRRVGRPHHVLQGRASRKCFQACGREGREGRGWGDGSCPPPALPREGHRAAFPARRAGGDFGSGWRLWGWVRMEKMCFPLPEDCHRPCFCLNSWKRAVAACEAGGPAREPPSSSRMWASARGRRSGQHEDTPACLLPSGTRGSARPGPGWTARETPQSEGSRPPAGGVGGGRLRES